jgi:hypothetical protein
MSLIEIDKHLPIPQRTRQKPRGKPGPKCKYPWLEMQIGDSILVSTVNYRSAVGLAWCVSTKYGRKFKAYEIDGAFRIWRIG